MGLIITLFLRVKEFVISIFFSSSEDFQRRKALKLLRYELKNLKFNFYRDDGELTPDFPAVIFHLFQSVLPLKKLITSTIASKDLRLVTKSIDLMIEQSFSEEQKKIKSELSMAKRMEKLEMCNKDEVESIMKEQWKLFNSFIMAISSSPDTKKIDLIAAKLNLFLDFASFSFNKFFSVFDSAYEPYIGTDKLIEVYNFQNVRAEKLVHDILDLNFLIRRLIIDEDLAVGFGILNSIQILKENKLPEETIIKHLHSIMDSLENELGKDTLIKLVKIIKEDPALEDKTPDVPQASIVKGYKERCSAAFQSDSKKILKYLQDSELKQLVESVFADIQMVSLIGYNEEINAKIQKVSTLSMDWVKPLQMIKTYTLACFIPIFQPILREIMVEGFFQDKDFAGKLGSAYYYCESLETKFIAFENIFDEKSPYSLKSINGFIEELERGGDFVKPLGKIIDQVNFKAKMLIEEAGKNYFDLYAAASQIIEDSKMPLPARVTNLKALIISAKNKEKFIEFEKGMKRFENFLVILKNYITLDNNKLKAGKTT